MKMQVFWTKFDENKLDDIFLYYEVKAGKKVAKNIVNNIIDYSLRLAKNPQMGQKELLLEDYPQNFRYLVIKDYKFIYWINHAKKRVEIATIFDTRQNPIKILN